MERYALNEQDKQLINLGLEVLKSNFDDGVYRHTVGCALRCNPRLLRRIHCDGHGHFVR